MWFQRKPKNPPNTTSPEGEPIFLSPTARAVDHDVTGLTFAEEVRNRILTVQERQRALIFGAATNGVKEAELPKLLADAMNAGEIPRIVRGMTLRGSGQTLHLLDGTIPDGAFEVYLLPSGVDPTKNSDFGMVIELKRGAREGEDYSINTTGTLPQTGHQPPDTKVLADIDAHMGEPLVSNE
ncbi:hypothetical protein EYC58_00625 [Candidatus Saccharibacteria bacterium]|nr:MAG: hypothetical protein EYC58_00625 [Candidatus Saccharibacteria bacterium]